MKVNLFYYVYGSKLEEHKFETIEGASSFYDDLVNQLSEKKEHWNNRIQDRWPILDREAVGYNDPFKDYEWIKLATCCYKHPKGKKAVL